MCCIYSSQDSQMWTGLGFSLNVELALPIRGCCCHRFSLLWVYLDFVSGVSAFIFKLMLAGPSVFDTADLYSCYWSTYWIPLSLSFQQLHEKTASLALLSVQKDDYNFPFLPKKTRKRFVVLEGVVRCNSLSICSWFALIVVIFHFEQFAVSLCLQS